LLKSYLVDPHNFETKIVWKEEQPLALIVYDRENSGELKIPIFRIIISGKKFLEKLIID